MIQEITRREFDDVSKLSNIDEIRAIVSKVPVLGLYGGQDTGIPVDTVEQIREKLKSSSSKSEIIVYPDPPHAFFADYRPSYPSYREKEAQDGWQRLQEWFQQYGV
ncbi:dienelactone hydrolase family protein [Dolichospermum compactum]|uniref:Twin-arginine translocation pathway signal n=1 Tax=Dolichospermum compactum NIES-806 TaxID=1973481 RepID=A0A1Z4V967_9CYAN|nr:dienelactone hydrolase family protein [Dolichospermum compactum]BAZ88121.1 twin-arginine translocation pathway signal [Dolichospermum compactum NIES-806]